MDVKYVKSLINLKSEALQKEVEEARAELDKLQVEHSIDEELPPFKIQEACANIANKLQVALIKLEAYNELLNDIKEYELDELD